MSNYDPGTIRRLLVEVFPGEEDFDFFCEDYFPEVVGKFSEGMSPAKKAHTLAQYCLQNGLVDKLLHLLERTNPGKYAEYKSLLFLPDASGPVVSITPTPAAGQAPGIQAAPPQSDVTADMPSTPPTTNDIFISYSRRDLAFVTQLHQELTRRGLSAWFDKENIQVGDHWRTSIVEGIRDCKAFVLVLSPASTASENVRKEVDLAERYKKRIVPLMWRSTEIPVIMEYPLIGIQWIDFKETASQENFSELTEVLQQLVGGASLAEATKDKPIAKEAIVPGPAKEEAVPAGPRPIGGLRKKPTISPTGVGGLVISSVVTTFNLDTQAYEDGGTSDKERISAELKWLFNAADNFLDIRRGTIDRNREIAAPIPSLARRQPQANNRLLNTIDNFDMQIWEGQIESGFKRIDIHLKNLDILLKQEAIKGEAGKGDVYLQNQIKGARLEIVKILQEMAELMNQAYGIFVNGPNELIDWLGQQGY